MKDPTIVASKFNNFFYQSCTRHLSKLFNSSDQECIHINNTHSVFNINEIIEAEVANIIGKPNTPRAKDDFDLDSNFLNKHKDTLIKPITHMIKFCGPRCMENWCGQSKNRG